MMIRSGRRSAASLAWAASALLAVAALAGCGTPAPIHYHTLTPAPSAQEASPVQGAAFVLTSVSLPSAVDVPELVVRRGQGQLRRMETQLWVAPLEDELRQAISTRLVSAHGLRNVDRLTARPPDAAWQVALAVRRMEVAPRGIALVEANWRVGGVGDRPYCAFSGQRPAGSGADDMVAAYQSLVSDLADAIAGSIETGAGCGAVP